MLETFTAIFETFTAGVESFTGIAECFTEELETVFVAASGVRSSAPVNRIVSQPHSTKIEEVFNAFRAKINRKFWLKYE